jgi:hypothetical protein
MRVSAIPAQITTVEDRIAGNLNLTQILLLAVPIFTSAVIFFVFPPIGKFSIYKLALIIFFSLICAGLALRLNNHLVIDILKQRAKYELRPRVYVFKKQQLSLVKTKVSEPIKPHSKHAVVLKEANQEMKYCGIGHKLLSDQKYSVTFHQRAGGLIVKVSFSG